MIDIQGAFDSVWWPIIANRLRVLGFCRNIQEVVLSYLSDREVMIENDGEVVHRKMDKGCPQGSVLGPVLWNLTFDELLERDLPPNSRAIAFADDVAFLI